MGHLGDKVDCTSHLQTSVMDWTGSESLPSSWVCLLINFIMNNANILREKTCLMLSLFAA